MSPSVRAGAGLWLAGPWLIRQDAGEALAARLRAVDPTAFGKAKAARTAPPKLAVDNGVATIDVRGVLIPEADDFLEWLGIDYSIYSGIRAQLAEADSSASVRSIRLDVNSPGGSVAGLYDTLAELEHTSKPITVAASMACSAAYMLASVAGSIEASSPASEFGSLGVAVSIWASANHYDLANTDSPNKRPDVRTEAGRDVIRSELDQYYELFGAAVARGRSRTAGRAVTLDTIRSDYGRGGIYLAERALAAGMIDSIASSSGSSRSISHAVSSVGKLAAREGTTVDLATFKAQYPSVYAAAVAEGRAVERDRVIGFINLGRQADALPDAIKDIEAGTEASFAAQTRYAGIAANRRDQSNYAADTASANAFSSGGGEGGGRGDLGDQVVAILGWDKPLSHRVGAQ